MAKQYKDRKTFLWTFFHFLVKFLNSGGGEGKVDLLVAIEGLGLDWSIIDLIKAGDEKTWYWLFVEAIKSKEELNKLKSLECCPDHCKNCNVIYSDIAAGIILGDVLFFVENLLNSRVGEARIKEVWLNPNQAGKLIFLL